MLKAVAVQYTLRDSILGFLVKELKHCVELPDTEGS